MRTAISLLRSKNIGRHLEPIPEPSGTGSFCGVFGAKCACPPLRGRFWDRLLVSILVPAYNAREFIDSALHDVSRQLYRNWELIVVEDGSIDDVEAAIQRFKTR